MSDLGVSLVAFFLVTGFFLGFSDLAGFSSSSDSISSGLISEGGFMLSTG